MKLIIMALLCAICSMAADAPVAKTLTDAQKLELARAQLDVTQIQARAEATVSQLKEQIQAADKRYLAITEKFLKSLNAGEGCRFDDKQELQCPAPKAEAAKPEAKK